MSFHWGLPETYRKKPSGIVHLIKTSREAFIYHWLPIAVQRTAVPWDLAGPMALENTGGISRKMKTMNI
jgi:hypothetical protein